MKKAFEISAKRQKQKGVVILLWTITLPTLISMMGLGVDASILYAVRTRLQLAADGSALAAARGLSVGLTLAEQVGNATAQADTWFRKNYGAGYFGSSNMADPVVAVYEDANNPRIRNVDVTAAATAPSYFMNFWGYTGTPIATLSRASRRDVVAMLVLDRSDSMNTADDACGKMRTAAKVFTNAFVEGRDRIGMVVYSETYQLASAPVTNFRTLLGDTTHTGMIDDITCGGWTGIPQAMAISYNELYKIALPGALNFIVFMTDGQPNTMTFNFTDTDAGTTALRGTSLCQDAQGDDYNDGAAFDFINSPRQWHAAINHGAGSWLPNVPAGSVGAVSLTEGPKEFVAAPDGSNYHDGEVYNNTRAPGCAFPGTWNASSDVWYYPRYDIYGNDALFPGYRAVTTSGPGIHPGGDMWDAAFNASASAAKRARTTRNLPSGTEFPGVTIYAIGLGGVDAGLMRRISNAPNTTGWTGNIATEPTGEYEFVADPDDLPAAFSKIASMILRLSR